MQKRHATPKSSVFRPYGAHQSDHKVTEKIYVEHRGNLTCEQLPRLAGRQQVFIGWLITSLGALLWSTQNGYLVVKYLQTDDNVGTSRYFWRAWQSQYTPWILKLRRFIPILREQLPSCQVWLCFQTKVSEKFAWIKCTWLDSFSIVILCSEWLIMEKPKMHYTFSSLFLNLQMQLIFKNLYEG